MIYSDASSKPGLLRNPYFDEWAGGQPTEWTHESMTNATYTELQKADPLTAETRTVFGRIGMKRSDADYIYGSESGFRITLAAAAAEDDWIIRQNASGAAGIIAQQKQRPSLRVTARCSVSENVLAVQLIGLVDTTDTYWLVPVGGTYFHGRTKWEWSTTETDIDLIMLTRWQTWGIQAPSIPLDVTSIAVQVDNGSAGAQVIDMGEVAMLDNVDMLGGAA